MARSPLPPSARAPGRAEFLCLGLVLLAALALRLWLAERNSGLTMDSPLYVRMAEDLIAGHHGPSPAHHGYPMLVALASLVLPGRELPGRAVSLIASLALVAIVWAMARRRTSPLAALAPALLAALHPLLAAQGTALMTEPVFLALAVGGVSLLDAGRARAGGALLGAAWWVRPEAVLLAPCAVLLAAGNWRSRGIALVLAAAVALPYTLVLRYEQGYWSLTPKTALVRAPFADARGAEWRLADGTAFADSVGLGERLARDGGAILHAYPARLAQHARRVLEAWPWPLLLMSAACVRFAAGRGPWLAFLMLPIFYPLVSAPADLRFAQLALPALLVPLRVVATPLARGAAVVRGLAALALLAGVLLLWSGRPGRAALAFDDGPMDAMRGAGAWLERHTATDAVIMDRKSYVAFFAERRHVQLPDEPLDTLLEWARTSGATHLVVEEYVVRSLRPQLAPLLDANAIAGDPRVRLVFATRPAPGDGVAVLELVR